MEQISTLRRGFEFLFDGTWHPSILLILGNFFAVILYAVLYFVSRIQKQRRMFSDKFNQEVLERRRNDHDT